MFDEGTERKQRERAMRDAGPLAARTIAHPEVAGAARKAPCRASIPRPGISASQDSSRSPLRLTWEEFSHLPMTAVTADMHCVTRWSRFDVRWEGVAFSEIVKLANAEARGEDTSWSKPSKATPPTSRSPT